MILWPMGLPFPRLLDHFMLNLSIDLSSDVLQIFGRPFVCYLQLHDAIQYPVRALWVTLAMSPSGN